MLSFPRAMAATTLATVLGLFLQYPVVQGQTPTTKDCPKIGPLVTFTSTIQTCDEYCNSIEKNCRAGQDESGNRCQTHGSELSCSRNVFTSKRYGGDAFCYCLDRPASPQPKPSSAPSVKPSSAPTFPPTESGTNLPRNLNFNGKKDGPVNFNPFRGGTRKNPKKNGGKKRPKKNGGKKRPKKNGGKKKPNFNFGPKLLNSVPPGPSPPRRAGSRSPVPSPSSAPSSARTATPTAAPSTAPVSLAFTTKECPGIGPLVTFTTGAIQTCGEYCDFVGKDCRNGQDELNDGCERRSRPFECSRNVFAVKKYGGDAFCYCRDRPASPQPEPSSAPTMTSAPSPPPTDGATSAPSGAPAPGPGPTPAPEPEAQDVELTVNLIYSGPCSSRDETNFTIDICNDLRNKVFDEVEKQYPGSNVSCAGVFNGDISVAVVDPSAPVGCRTVLTIEVANIINPKHAFKPALESDILNALELGSEPNPEPELKSAPVAKGVYKKCPTIGPLVTFTKAIQTCGDFCASHHKDCRNGQDEFNNQCVTRNGKFDCSRNVFTKKEYGKDAFCFCIDAEF